MEYLKYYNLTDEDLKIITEKLEISTLDIFTFNPEKIKLIIEYLVAKGIRNIKYVIMFRSNLFHNDLEGIKSSFENSTIENIVELINEDLVNFELIGL